MDTTVEQGIKAEHMIADAKHVIPDAEVARALYAYESLPTGAGRFERMRQALYAHEHPDRGYRDPKARNHQPRPGLVHD